MRKNLVICFGLICLVASISRLDSKAVEKSVYVIVAAGSVDRKDSVVSFTMSKDRKAKSYWLIDESGDRLPLQVEPDGTATFVLSELKAGMTKRFRLEDVRANTIGTSRSMELIRDHDRFQYHVRTKSAHVSRRSGRVPSPEIKPISARRFTFIRLYTVRPSVTDDYPPIIFIIMDLVRPTRTEFSQKACFERGNQHGKVEFVALDQLRERKRPRPSNP
jgi:hypothetical protein